MISDMSKLADTRAREWELLEKIRREAMTHPPVAAPDPERTVITISRETGAMGHTVGDKVLSLLGADWRIWDREIVDAVAKSAKVRSELAAKFDDRLQARQDSILRYLTNYWGFKPSGYYQHLIEVLVTLSQEGRKIVIGRGANFVLPHALKIRLYASEGFRARNLAKQQGIAVEEAAVRMQAEDKERASFVHAFFGRNIADPAAYDLTFRMDRISPDTAAAAIVAAIQSHMGETNGGTKIVYSSGGGDAQ